MPAKAHSQTNPFHRLTTFPDTLRDLRAESVKLVGRVRKQAVELVGEDRRQTIDVVLDRVSALRADLQKRRRKVIKEFESRATRIYDRLESQAKRGVEPIVRRLNLPSKHDVELLGRRLATLEKKVERLLDGKA